MSDKPAARWTRAVPRRRALRSNYRLFRGGETFETEARVLYVSPGLGMGIRFLEHVTERQLGILDRWLGEAARTL